MDSIVQWRNSVLDSLNELSGLAAAFLPKAAVAILVILAGWLLAWILSSLIRRLMGSLDYFAKKFPQSSAHEFEKFRITTTKVVASVSFWIVILIFFTVGLNILQLEIVNRWVDELLLFLPRLIAAAIIVTVGLLLGGLTRSLLLRTMRFTHSRHSELAGRIIWVGIVGLALVIAIEQVGIDLSFLTQIIIIGFAVIGSSFSLGVALATPVYISNLISATNVRKYYHEGDHISIDKYTGRIKAILPAAVVIETQRGETSLPAKLFAELPVEKLSSSHQHDNT